MNRAATFGLDRDELHVWSCALDVPAEEVRRLGLVLSAEERARAAAFHFPRDGSRFIVAHGRLREWLAGYLDCPAGALRFGAAEKGKPLLASGDAGDLRFNLSHSGDRALVAVARGCEVGIDLERIRPEVDAAGIMASHFSPMERAAWAALPESRKTDAFFHGWVRKEAYVKARGEGLLREGAAYSVEINPTLPAALLDDAVEPDAPAKWRLEALMAPAGFAAAIAYAAPQRAIIVREV